MNSSFSLEIPYALPPRRFEDPEPLPEGHKYEEKEYVFESKCACLIPTNRNILRLIRKKITPVERDVMQMLRSQLTMDKLLVRAWPRPQATWLL